MQMQKGRVGQFFLIIGLISLVIFITTNQVDNPTYGYFVAGLALSLLGGFMIFQDRKPPAPTARFHSYRKMRQKQAERKAKKKARQAEKEKKRNR